MPSRQELAEAFLGKLNPNATIVAVNSHNPEVNERMDQAGLGMANVTLPDRSGTFQAPYLVKATPHTAALVKIWEEEAAGMLPKHSHTQAIDSIIRGDFDSIWGGYLSKPEIAQPEERPDIATLLARANALSISYPHGMQDLLHKTSAETTKE